MKTGILSRIVIKSTNFVGFRLNNPFPAFAIKKVLFDFKFFRSGAVLLPKFHERNGQGQGFAQLV